MMFEKTSDFSQYRGGNLDSNFCASCYVSWFLFVLYLRGLLITLNNWGKLKPLDHYFPNDKKTPNGLRLQPIILRNSWN